ncbi:MAG: homocysteine S-methyltransferase family protein [Pseudomonadota bacterium]
MRRNFFKELKKKPVIFDGAMGTMLMAAGLPPGEAPEAFNMKKPELIRDIHRQYFEAGADVVITNTFGGNTVKLNAKGLGAQIEAINEAGAGNAKKACPPDKWVAGDMGPTGKFLKPLGDLSIEEMEDAYYLQASFLIKGGVDLLIIETIYSLDEALAALKSAKRAGDIPVIVSMTFNRTKKGFFTMMGESISRAIPALDAAGADAVGVNCTLGTKDMIDITKEIREETQKPILIEPNAGKPVNREGITYYEQTPQEFAGDAEKIVQAGADMIGGCCGTTPEFIRELSRVLS